MSVGGNIAPKRYAGVAVDDEALLFFSLQDMLEDLGCSVVASAPKLEDGLSKARVLDFDIAVLDVNLSGNRGVCDGGASVRS